MTVSRARVSDGNFPSLSLRLDESGARLNYRCRDRAEFDALTRGARNVIVTHDENNVLKVELVT